MNQIVANDEMLKIKEKIDNEYIELTNNINNINTQFDSINSNWKGNKANLILKPIEEIKKNNENILKKIALKSEQILNAYNVYLKSQDTYIAVSPITTVDQTTTQAEIVPEEAPTPISTSEKLKALQLDFSGFQETLLPVLIHNEVNGINAYSSYTPDDLMNLVIKYNASPNIINVDDPSYLQNSANSLNVVQQELKNNNLWGTPSAVRIVSLWMISTGYKIPTTASIKKDNKGNLVEGVGNQRGIGVGNNWNKEGNGLDCTNFAYWLTLNSGLLTDNNGNPAEGMALNNPYNRGSKITQNSIPGFYSGDIVATPNHVGVYLFSDDKYVYTFETVSNAAFGKPGRGLGDYGTSITITPINSTVPIPDSFNNQKWFKPIGYWDRIASIFNVSLDRATVPHTGNIVLKPNN